MADDRFERLANLVTYLLEAERGATYADIIAVIPGYPEGEDTRRRAFERDKKLLRDEDIPLVEEDGRYRIPPEEYYLPELDLTEDEHLALQLAVAAVPNSARSAGAALQKLALASSGGGAEALAGAGPSAVADLDEHPLLPSLHAAIRRRSQVTFTHSGTERVVEPTLLFFRDGHWYLHGYDRTRAGVRNYRIDRIEGGVVSVGDPGAFEPPPRPARAAEAMAREPWTYGGDEPESAVVRVDATLAGKATAEAGPEASSRALPDGGVELTMPVVQREAFRSWVLGMLDHAEVIGPPGLRSEVVGWLQAIVAAG